MSRILEITQLDNGDIVLREDDDVDPLISLRFSEEVREMLGQDLIGVAEAMIDAATDYLSGDAVAGEEAPGEDLEPPPVLH